MEFAYSEEQQMLRDSARRFLADKAPSETVRALMEGEDGFDEALWGDIAAQGWQAMHIPEEYGGAGFSYLELAVLMEEMGRALFPVPYFSTVVLGANTLLAGASDRMKKELLPAVASGELRLALAHLEPGKGWDLDEIEVGVGADMTISGEKAYVVDGHTAHKLLVVVREGEGLSIFVVDGGAPGVSRRKVETLDMTRKMAAITFEGVVVTDADRVGDAGAASPVLTAVGDLAAVALAAECVGGAERCLEMSVDYAKVRMQFGRPIGSFQAIKHKCADMLVEVESARSASMYASWAAAEDDAELAIMAPLAKAVCSEAYFHCASENIQIHGGIGFTWEHDAHLYFKRAKSSELLLGDPARHRELLAARLGL